MNSSMAGGWQCSFAVPDHGRRCDLLGGGIVMDLDADLSDIRILGKWD
jgi:hypothetical protein